MNYYQEKFNKDFEFGTNKELEVLEVIKQYFNDDEITKTNNQFCSFDFHSDDKRFELKSRNNAKNKYPTTMVGKNKIDKILKSKNKSVEHYFLFSFEDGLYYIKYDEDLFNTFETNVGGRRDRGRKEYNEYIFIPVNKLTEIIL